MAKKVISFYPINHLTPNIIGPLDGNVTNIREIADRYQKKIYHPFLSGRSALDWLFASMKLAREDEVWIVTTFDLPNVSSCVTSTVFNYCKPSRVLSEKTKAVLVIHEFGIPHPDLFELSLLSKKRGIPLIEDCAHTLNSRIDGNLVGSVGDWTVFSFPKIFPLQIGGAILGNSSDYEYFPIETQQLKILQDQVNFQFPLLDYYSELRRKVFRALSEEIQKNKLKPFIQINENVSPWFFPIETTRKQEYLHNAQDEGIDCALWHGTDIIILPCHQFLFDEDIKRISNFVNSIENC